MRFIIATIILAQIIQSTEQNAYILKIGDYKNITSNSCGLKAYDSTSILPQPNRCFKWHQTIIAQRRSTVINSIKGGSFAKEGEVPYTVFIKTPKGRCTGAIISEVWIITAAHCIDVEDRTKDNLIIYSGIKVFRYPHDRKRLLEAEKVIIHPRYNIDGLGRVDHDIGLIKLTEKIVPNEDIPDANSVCLPGNILPNRYHITKPSLALFSGWGYIDDEREREKHEGLKVLMLTINRYLGDLKISTRDLKLGHGCKGDSGGPLVQYVNGRAVLIGVAAKITVSGNKTDKKCGKVVEMKFASVTYDVDWIIETIRKNS